MLKRNLLKKVLRKLVKIFFQPFGEKIYDKFNKKSTPSIITPENKEDDIIKILQIDKKQQKHHFT